MQQPPCRLTCQPKTMLNVLIRNLQNFQSSHSDISKRKKNQLSLSLSLSHFLESFDIHGVFAESGESRRISRVTGDALTERHKR